MAKPQPLVSRFKYENDPHLLLDEHSINTYFIYRKMESVGLEFTTPGELLSIIPDLCKIRKAHVFSDSFDNVVGDFFEYGPLDVCFNRIMHIFILLFHMFNQIKHVYGGPLKLTKEISERWSSLPMDGHFMLRTGIIELRLVCAYEYGNREKMRIAATEVLKKYSDEEYMYRREMCCWRTIEHTSHAYSIYIRKIMTNAGFYIDPTAGVDKVMEEIGMFCDRYKQAMENADYLYHMSVLTGTSLDFFNDMKRKGRSVSLVQGLGATDIGRIVNGKRLLIATPFKHQIDKVYMSGNIYKINPVFRDVKLRTLEVAITTYPNRHMSTFSETLGKYFVEIDRMYAEDPFDVFSCSAGCYGALLCDYVHKKYGCSTFYLGHHINEMFGVRSTRMGKVDVTNPRIALYEKSDIHLRYKNLEKIENNCYGLPEKVHTS